ncbi:MAG: hypothetical protein RSD47_10830 [Romboutsia sp.]
MEYNIIDLTLNIHRIPAPILIDSMKRIIDWTSSNGSYEDEYVKKQIKYAMCQIKEEPEC